MFIYEIDEDLYLRLIEKNDEENIFSLINNSRDYLRQWLSWVDNTRKLEDTKEFIKICLKGITENKNMTSVILFQGQIVGLVGYEINWSNKTACIGYWLGEEFQKNRIMNRVVKALTNYVFTNLNLNKVEIRVAEGNKRSRNIPEKLGYVNEGCIRQVEWLYDRYVNHVVYGILAEEWNN
ncbi:GNAT family protein [Metabacillus fastidiosus]|uniref:GNAT family N-acetyltransferase n=1 Tax=Metabacillus fastidiosus TaxID=1458 RepID=UPI002E1B4A4B|nr:GNAT family protein [Metabacillus fastidiosus]